MSEFRVTYTDGKETTFPAHNVISGGHFVRFVDENGLTLVMLRGEMIASVMVDDDQSD